MNLRKAFVGTSAAAALAVSSLAFAPVASANQGEKSLASVLTAQEPKLDKNQRDYDIVTRAVLTVLDAKPNSAVSVLADGSVAATAFIPNDRAFKILAGNLQGIKQRKALKRSERWAFNQVAKLGVDTVESVLLYHVVPGGPILAKDALKADGARLKTAQGRKIKVKVTANPTKIILKDKDPDLRNPRVLLKQTDINKGNKQVAHGINRVLLPINI